MSFNGRVTWSDPILRGGHLFEQVVGCLLGNEHHNAARVRTSGGDGGIDILHPVDGGWDVYQCKHYVGPISWSKVRKSLDRLVALEHFKPVKTWYLVLPKQPSVDEIVKLDELAKGYDFPLVPFGEDRLDSLAAKYPFVVDNFFGDPGGRKQRLAEDWANLQSLVALGEYPDFVEVVPKLVKLCSDLSARHSYFDFYFRVSSTPLDATHLATEPGTVMAACWKFDDRWAHLYLLPRFPYATEAAAEAGDFGLTMLVGGEHRAALEHLLRFGGAPVELDPASVALELSGINLGQDLTEAFVRISPAERQIVDPFARLVLTDVAGNQAVGPMAAVITGGVDGKTIAARSRPGAVAVDLVVDGNGVRQGSVSVDVADFTTIVDLQEDLGLIRCLALESAELMLAPPHGPLAGVTTTVSGPIIDPDLYDYLDGLSFLQSLVTEPVLIPGQISRLNMRDTVKLARLYRGELVMSSWNDLKVTFSDAEEAQTFFAGHPPDSQWLFWALQSSSWTLEPEEGAGRTPERRHGLLFRSARISTLDLGDDGTAVLTLVPGKIPWSVEGLAMPDETEEALYERVKEVDPDLPASLQGVGE